MCIFWVLNLDIFLSSKVSNCSSTISIGYPSPPLPLSPLHSNARLPCLCHKRIAQFVFLLLCVCICSYNCLIVLVYLCICVSDVFAYLCICGCQELAVARAGSLVTADGGGGSHSANHCCSDHTSSRI